MFKMHDVQVDDAFMKPDTMEQFHEPWTKDPVSVVHFSVDYKVNELDVSRPTSDELLEALKKQWS